MDSIYLTDFDENEEREVKVPEFVGEILTHVDVGKDEYEDQDQILLTTESGRQFLLTHDQDCCELVRIEGTDGEWSQLFGKVIEDVSWREKHTETDEDESRTDTTLAFKVNDATVISRWIGTSNGCYSESVNIKELKEEFKRKVDE